MNRFFAACALAVLASPSVAAEDTTPFSGFYVGAELGGNWHQSQKQHELYNDSTQKSSSLYYGGLFGYRFDFSDTLILGLEGTIGRNNDDIALAPKDGLFFPQVIGADGPHAGTHKSTGEWSISGTLGTSFGTDNKHYVFGSVGFAQAAYKFDADSRTDLNHKYRYNGLRLGAGYEYALTHHLSLRANATFTNYNDGKITAGPEQLLYLGLRDSHKWQTNLGVLYSF